MASIVVAGDTSGTVTLTAPAVSGTTTLTLPTTSGTIIAGTAPSGAIVGTTDTQTLTNKTLGAGTVMPTGSVLQVVQASSAGGSTASTSFTDMGLSASITPKYNTSKILVQVNGVYRTAATLRAGFSIVRGSTNIQSATEMVILPSASVTNNSYYLTVLDSPATTSSTTYKVQFQSNSSGTVYTNDAGTVAVGNINYITLFEVAA